MTIAYHELSGDPAADRALRAKARAQEADLAAAALGEVRGLPEGDRAEAAATILAGAVRGLSFRRACDLIFHAQPALALATCSAAPRLSSPDEKESESMSLASSAPTSAYEAALALAKPLMARDATLTKVAALTIVFSEHPDLAERHRAEACLTRRGPTIATLEKGTAADAANPNVTHPSDGGPARTSEAGRLWEEIKKAAVALMDKDPTLQREPAIAKVLAQHPEMYKAYTDAVVRGV